MRRLLLAAAFIVAALGLAPGADAAAPPVVGVAGSATPIAATPPATVTFHYAITVTNAAASGVVITTAQDAALPADTSSVRLDGAAVPAATLTGSGADFTLRAGTGADGSNGGTLAVGTHTLSFTSSVTSTTAALATSTVTVSHDSTSVTSAPITVALNEPELSLALPPDSGEDHSAPLGTGDSIYFGAELRNLGPATPAQLSIVLPTGLALGADGVILFAHESDWDVSDGTPLSCTGTTGTVTCALDTVAMTGATDDPPLVQVALTATSDGVPGTSATFTVSVSPTKAADADPSNNTVHATLDFTGVADLTFAIDPPSKSVVIGSSTTLSLSVTNHGPQDAVQSVGISLLDGDTYFRITDFDGNTTPPTGAPLARMAGTRALTKAFSRHGDTPGLVRAAGVGPLGSDTGVIWFIGTIPAGQTVTAHLTVQARAVGTARIALFAGSAAADPGCAAITDPCEPALGTLTAVAAPVDGSPTPTATSSHSAAVAGVSTTAPPLAATGEADGRLVLTGALLLLVGGFVTVAGRRRRTGSHALR